MKIRLWLSIRVLLLIVVSAGVVFFTTLKIISQNFKKNAYKETLLVNDNNVSKYSSIIKTSIEKDFAYIRSYARIAESKGVENFDKNRGFSNEILISLITNNPSYTAAWDSWEMRFTHEKWGKSHGRISRSFYRSESGIINLKVDTLDIEGDSFESLYYMYKLVPEEAITDPYWYSYTGKKKDEILESSIVVPLMINNEFAGLAGIDLSLEHFQKMVETLNQDKDFYISLFSFNGDIIAHSNKNLIGKNIVVADTFLTKRYNILDRIQSGKASSFIIKDASGNDSSYFTISSFTIGETHTPWAMLIEAPLQKIESQVEGVKSNLNKVMIFGLLILLIITSVFALFLVRPLKKTKDILKKLADGNVGDIQQLKINSSDEIAEMALSVNTVIEGMDRVTLFAENIGKGNYDFEITQLSKSDMLGNAIIEMRNSLKKAKEDEIQRIEKEKQLEWASQGINLFNKILRIDNQNLEILSYEIIKTLVLYLESHMGGIYLKNNLDEKELELVSYIGFSKEKYEHRFIKFGEGDVGRCALEMETIFMDEIPAEYSKVTSGLGRSNPLSVLLVPLISNRELVGVLEIESLKVLQKYQIAYVERISENIASALSSVKINVRTVQLLDKSQKQAEELEQQEEEIRQTMEEMQATQEEAHKREEELHALIKGYHYLMPIIEYDLKGRITDVNENYLKIYKTRKSQIIGKQHKADLFMNEMELQKHQEFWNKLNDGKEQESVEYIKSGKEDYWLVEKFIPIKDKYGLINKILCIGVDITELKKTESKLKHIQEEVSSGRSHDKFDSNKKVAPIIDLNQELTIVDLNYLKMVYKKDSSKIYNILKLYYDTLPAQIEEVNKLAKDREYTKLKQRINSLKTKMSYLGLKQIYDNLGTIEKLIANQKNLTEIPTLLKTNSTYWSIAQQELKKLLKLP